MANSDVSADEEEPGKDHLQVELFRFLKYLLHFYKTGLLKLQFHLFPEIIKQAFNLQIRAAKSRIKINEMRVKNNYSLGWGGVG